MWVTNAQYSNGHVNIDYNTWAPGTGYTQHALSLETYPNGDWSKIKFDRHVSLTHFLNAMVHKNLEVSRKIAELSLEAQVERYQDNNEKLTKLMHAITILDDTFTPPILNDNCRWQMELLYDIVVDTSYRVIVTCRNQRRLENYFKNLEML
jgi:hypothetical protein